MKTDVITPPEVGEEEPAPRITARRVVRWVTILTVGILAVLAFWQEPLHAGFR